MDPGHPESSPWFVRWGMRRQGGLEGPEAKLKSTSSVSCVKVGGD